MSEPTLRLLSLGAGVQSTTMAILSARGKFEPLDGAIFADTGWEPRAVYEHLDRLNHEVLQPAGIPLYRVTSGNIRSDALDPAHRFASMPLYVKDPDGGRGGLARRQCTSEYKLKPIKRQIRLLLGARRYAAACRHVTLDHGCSNCYGTGLDVRVGQPPRSRWAEQWIGFSVDESHRALDAKSAAYSRSRFPLLERSLSRADCQAINKAAGFPDVAKSACIGCPYHRNRQWRELRNGNPTEWADAVDFDRAIRNGSARATFLGMPLRGQMYLHESMVPLDQAPIDRVTRRELLDRQGDILTELSALHVAMELDDDESEVIGCGPFTCRVTGDRDDTEEAS